MIYFVGAGPGDRELLTVKGANLLSQADCIIYAGSLVNPELLEYAKKSCKIYDSAAMTLEEVIDVMLECEQNGSMTVRLHTGDPSLYGAIREQIDRLVARDIPFEVVPGVSSFAGAAAALGAEYTLPGVSQTLILTRMEGRTPVPEKERITELAEIQASMVVFLSSDKLRKLSKQLIEGGYAPDTPAAIVYKVSWPDEKIIKTTIAELADEGEKHDITKTALILVGRFLGETYDRSLLYHPDFTHGYRNGRNIVAARKSEPRHDGSAFTVNSTTMREMFLMVFTEKGEKLAARIAEKIAADKTMNLHIERVRNLNDVTRRAFAEGNILVYIGAVGITVRAVAPFLKNKMTDPAVVVIDDSGRFVIPILAGHVGGANRIAMQIAALVGATPVMTTATDINGVFAVDLFAVENGYHIVNPEMIKTVSAALLEGNDVGLTSEFPIIGDLARHVVLNGNASVGIHIGTGDAEMIDKMLRLVPKCYHVGIGTKKNTSFDDLHAFFLETLLSRRIPIECVASVSSIDLKQDEKAIVTLARKYEIPFRTYSTEEMASFEKNFRSSDFVKSTTGVGNVCEISAWLSAKYGEVIVGKISRSGMTMAVAQEAWQVCFEPHEGETEGAS